MLSCIYIHTCIYAKSHNFNFEIAVCINLWSDRDIYIYIPYIPMIPSQIYAVCLPLAFLSWLLSVSLMDSHPQSSDFCRILPFWRFLLAIQSTPCDSKQIFHTDLFKTCYGLNNLILHSTNMSFHKNMLWIVKIIYNLILYIY